MPEFPYEFLEESPEELPAIYKTKTFNLDPMLVDEARFAIERLGHDFFAFLNAESGGSTFFTEERMANLVLLT